MLLEPASTSARWKKRLEARFSLHIRHIDDAFDVIAVIYCLVNRRKYFGNSMRLFFPRVFHSEAGVEALELAVILPVFIGLIFGFIDVARRVSGYSSVRTAAFVGARYAVASQRSEWTAVSAALGGASNNSASIGSSTLNNEPVFVSQGSHSNWYHDQCLSQGIDPPELFRLELRAIAYANKIMSESVGKAEYPCVEQGCFHCFTLRGDAVNYDRYFSVTTSAGVRTWAAKVLAISCTYQVPITSALFGLGWLPQFLPVTGQAYVPINDYAGSAYNPDA